MPTAIQAAISLNSDSRVVAERQVTRAASTKQIDLRLADKILRRPNQDLSFLKEE